VQTQFANIDYISAHCKTPIQKNYDTFDEGRGRTTACNEIEHAAMAYHNYHTYLSTWTDLINNGSGGQTFDTRPTGYALHLDNTTISAPWIDRKNITELEGKPQRFVNNITMAMPHIGVIQAATDPRNKLMQPDDTDGVQINIRASTPSPFVNVLCLTLHEQDLEPFIYPDKLVNGTEYDDVFQWGEKWGPNKHPPVFPRLPIDYNTLLNDTSQMLWGRRTVYILGKVRDSKVEGAWHDAAMCCRLENHICFRTSTNFLVLHNRAEQRTQP
jgi:hypothetical protein